MNKSIPDNIKDIDSEIKELSQRMLDLRKTKEQLENISPERRLAILLHSKLCRWNHIDGCSWEYEVTESGHNWAGYAHADYLSKATRIVNEAGKLHLNLKDVESLMSIAF